MAGNPTRGGDELATIIYTSGTTGTPKGVMHSFNALGYDAKVLAALIKLNDKERVLSYLPLAHIVERAGMEGTAVYLGYRVFFSEGIDTFLADLARARPTIFLSVPRLLLKFQQGVFAKIPQRKLERLLRIPILNRAVKKRVLHKLGLGHGDQRRQRRGSAAYRDSAVVSQARTESRRGIRDDRDADYAPAGARFGATRLCGLRHSRRGGEAQCGSGTADPQPDEYAGVLQESGKHEGLLSRRTDFSGPATWRGSIPTGSSRLSAD